jgi:hypothetical protein
MIMRFYWTLIRPPDYCMHILVKVLKSLLSILIVQFEIENVRLNVTVNLVSYITPSVK